MGAERVERARASLGKPLDEVPAAENLTIRVVSSVEKKLETKPAGFKDQNYPTSVPHRRVLLLFQKIEGVDVHHLLGIYVQEYGQRLHRRPTRARVAG